MLSIKLNRGLDECEASEQFPLDLISVSDWMTLRVLVTRSLRLILMSGLQIISQKSTDQWE